MKTLLLIAVIASVLIAPTAILLVKTIESLTEKYADTGFIKIEKAQ